MRDYLPEVPPITNTLASLSLLVYFVWSGILAEVDLVSAKCSNGFDGQVNLVIKVLESERIMLNAPADDCLLMQWEAHSRTRRRHPFGLNKEINRSDINEP